MSRRWRRRARQSRDRRLSQPSWPSKTLARLRLSLRDEEGRDLRRVTLRMMGESTVKSGWVSSPVELQLPLGTMRLLAIKDGFEAQEASIVLRNEGDEESLDLRLLRGRGALDVRVQNSGNAPADPAYLELHGKGRGVTEPLCRRDGHLWEEAGSAEQTQPRRQLCRRCAWGTAFSHQAVLDGGARFEGLARGSYLLVARFRFRAHSRHQGIQTRG